LYFFSTKTNPLFATITFRPYLASGSTDKTIRVWKVSGANAHNANNDSNDNNDNTANNVNNVNTGARFLKQNSAPELPDIACFLSPLFPAQPMGGTDRYIS
jgi:hypothetical protein